MECEKKYYYYTIFGITFLHFSLVQDNIRPNYDGGNSLIIFISSGSNYPKLFTRNWFTSLFYVIIPEVFKPNSFFFKERLKLSIYISMFGLRCNEFITIFTPGRGVLIGMISYGL